MKVHHLNAATLCPRGARFVNGTGGLLRRARLVCHVLLVETDHGLVLVDAGLGSADIANPERLGPSWVRLVAPRLELAETAVAQVRALGFSPSDVRHVVLTHLDIDHAGGIEDFPAATVHVHAREQAAALARQSPREQRRYRPSHLTRASRFRVYEGGGESWFGFEGARALDDEDSNVLLIPLFGHTHGHCGVAVRSGDRWLLHAGDAYFFHGQLAEKAHAPFALSLFQRRADTDRRQRRLNQERLRELALRHPHEVSVFSAHDPVELDRMESRRHLDLSKLAADENVEARNPRVVVGELRHR
jgi:glyoxylase-like metal-dependent hydrolase (beta-lactamase superfamily II)